MKLTLALPLDDATRLPRLKLLADLKAGRRRNRAVSILWHDTAEAALAEQGLALAEQGSLWRLERLVPEDRAWPPGATPELVAQATALERIEHKLPAGLRGMARFDGQISLLPLQQDGVPLTLELLQGTIGWARRRRPVCRLTLEGAAAPVIDLAMRLAEELDIAIPPGALAAEACAVATATPLRRKAPAELRSGLTVAGAFTQVLGRLADATLHGAQSIQGGSEGTEPVHEMRVAVRRLRSTIAVFRPAIFCPLVDTANLGLKALADRLAPARDLDVFIAETSATVGKALPDDAGLRRLRAAADRRRRDAYAALRTWLGSPEFRHLTIALAGLADSETWQATADATQQEALGQELQAFAAQALKRRLRRLTEAGDTIDQLEPPALHAIRLRAKRMRYAAEIFAPLFSGKATRRFLRRLSALQERLGALNDGAVADALLTDLGATTGGRAHAAGLVRGFLAARAGNARSRIARAWQRFRRLEPFWS